MEAEWTPQSVWMFQITEKSTFPAAIQNLYHPACSPVTILTEHSGQNYKCSAENCDLFITISKILNIHIIIIIIIIIMVLYRYISRIFNASCTLGYTHSQAHMHINTGTQRHTHTHFFSKGTVYELHFPRIKN